LIGDLIGRERVQEFYEAFGKRVDIMNGGNDDPSMCLAGCKKMLVELFKVSPIMGHQAITMR